MNLSYRPLPATWPTGKRTDPALRQRSPFRSTRAATMKLLDHELLAVGVKRDSTVIVETGYAEGMIRLDGLPRQDAKLNDPAVILSFESRFGPLRYGCDAFETFDTNLRAIALALVALRAVDRYGVSKRGEQYQGWAALPAAGESESSRDHEAYIRQFAGPGLNLQQAYRLAVKQLHPDAGGSREDWDRLQRARVALNL